MPYWVSPIDGNNVFQINVNEILDCPGGDVFFRFFSIPFTFFALLFSLPPCHNSDPETQQALAPTPRYGSCFVFLTWQEFSPFFPPSTRVELCPKIATTKKKRCNTPWTIEPTMVYLDNILNKSSASTMDEGGNLSKSTVGYNRL